MAMARALFGGLHGDRAETLIGAVVILVGAALMAITSFNRHDSEAPDGAYQVEAVFNRADGIGVGTEVRLAGIPVGRVVDHILDEEYRAVVTMRLDLGGEELSDDAAAKIQTDGLLGAKYIEIASSGGGFGTIPSGERLDFSQDSVIIEDLLSKIVAMAKVKRGMDPNIPASEQDIPPPPPPPSGPRGGTCPCGPAPLFAPWQATPDGGTPVAPKGLEQDQGQGEIQGGTESSPFSPSSPSVE
jgi:phospholipid/cholesterol/gamma-HCH transport system substrate-binding protein